MGVKLKGLRIVVAPKGPNGAELEKRPPCDYCDEPAHEFGAWPGSGSNQGCSTQLRRNLLDGAEPDTHPWYMGAYSIAAHHLICSEAVEDDDDWFQYCWQFGYDINRRENGVMLPSVPAVACELEVPLHRGPHLGGWAFDVNLAYPDAVKSLLEGYSRVVGEGGYCSKPSKLITDLDRLSGKILGNIARGAWTLTSDGLDYMPGGRGCSGVRSIVDKPALACPLRRRHNARHAGTKKPLARRALQVGT